MKTLNEYMALSYRMEVVEDKEEGGFVVSYPDLPGCLTCGETIETAVANAVEAKKIWLEACLLYTSCEPLQNFLFPDNHPEALSLIFLRQLSFFPSYAASKTPIIF